HWRRCNNLGQVFGFGYCFSVKLHDHVSLLDLCLFRRASREDLRHEGAFVVLEAERFRQFRGHLLDAHAEPSTGYMALFLKLGSDVFSHVDRDGEANAFTLCKDRGVDTHPLPSCIDERPTAVAGIDRRIGLNEVVIGARANYSSLSADNTCRDGLFQAKRTTDGHDPTTNF